MSEKTEQLWIKKHCLILVYINKIHIVHQLNFIATYKSVTLIHAYTCKVKDYCKYLYWVTWQANTFVVKLMKYLIINTVCHTEHNHIVSFNGHSTEYILIRLKFKLQQQSNHSLNKKSKCSDDSYLRQENSHNCLHLKLQTLLWPSKSLNPV